jgi:predicted Zn-dependent protease
VGEEGLAALRALSDRLAPEAGLDGPLRITVLDHPGRDAFLLPGGHVVLLRGLLHAAHAPEEVAGVIAHAIGHARARDPLRATIDQAGVVTLAAILLGDITGERVIGQSAVAMGLAHRPEAEARADAAGFAVLAGAGLPSLSYAALADRLSAGGQVRYLDRHPWTVARAKAAAAADRIGEASFTPALRDRDWIALNAICDRTRPADPAGF